MTQTCIPTNFSEMEEEGSNGLRLLNVWEPGASALELIVCLYFYFITFPLMQSHVHSHTYEEVKSIILMIEVQVLSRLPIIVVLLSSNSYAFRRRHCEIMIKIYVLQGSTLPLA